ncbi:MAG: hypothetical protein HFI82_13205 [Eubacterium sp.]|jgi:hypothetical protein|nr:hypothetical protein [Eubacterium sp.]
MKEKGGYGLVYQKVMRNSNLDPESKAIYAYLSSIAGSGDSCYPSVETMQKELRMGKNRLMKYMGQLIAFGVVEKVREKKGNIYGRNTYKIIHKAEVRNELKCIFEKVENEAVEIGAVEIGAVEIGAVENEAINNNNTNNNNINNNNIKKDSINYQEIVDLYNNTCVSFPRLTKLSDSRKKAIKARLNQYTVEDFKKLFEMAEGSSFLKGQNSRNWSANFDWLIKDSNMAKALDGNYADKEGGGYDGTDSQGRGSAADFYERFLGSGNGN